MGWCQTNQYNSLLNARYAAYSPYPTVGTVPYGYPGNAGYTAGNIYGQPYGGANPYGFGNNVAYPGTGYPYSGYGVPTSPSLGTTSFNGYQANGEGHGVKRFFQQLAGFATLLFANKLLTA